ncbi:MAG: murein biosynthesis integral membrane protein MurJ [Pseudomonadota bacterium]|nr:murein biosynthesis integral membrane protein MurJ [Pseudomonadota bacterium]
MSLARNTLVQSTLTLGSRVLGFARDLALANQFGQGPLMDAWATALMVPNLFRRLFAEGAFAQAFVPVYGKVRAEDGEAQAADVASQALSFIMAAVLLFVIAAQVAMPWLMPLLLSAYRDDPETLRIGTIATQLAMPYLACMTLASLLSGVLNTSGRFALAAGVPAALNVCTLVPLLLITEDEPALLAASAAVTVSGLVQAGLLWWGTRRLGVRLRLRAPKLTPAVKRVLAIAVPGALAGGALQLNSLVSQVLTGSDEGARAVLYNADRLYQLPLGLVGVAIGLALVPRLTRSFVSGDHEGARATMDEGIGLAMLFTLPAAVALFVAPFFIIDATVTRGEFTSADAARTADVLRHFAWGVPAFVLAKVLTPPFFARQDTRRPMQYAIVAVVVTVVLGAGLFYGFGRIGIDGVVGLAIATSVAAWANVALLAGTLIRENIYRPGPAMIGRLLRVGAAAAVMGALVLAGSIFYETLSQLLLSKEIAVLAAVLAGGLAYGLAALLFGAVTRSELKAALRRERGAPAAAGPGFDA